MLFELTARFKDLKLLSQQKGEDPETLKTYTYNTQKGGQDSWIVVIDTGFDLKHEVTRPKFDTRATMLTEK